MIKQLKNNKGITLIALVVTIVVLLTLAGVSISSVVGNNGIIKKTITAKKEIHNSSDLEIKEINKLNDKIEHLYMTQKDGLKISCKVSNNNNLKGTVFVQLKGLIKKSFDDFYKNQLEKRSEKDFEKDIITLARIFNDTNTEITDAELIEKFKKTAKESNLPYKECIAKEVLKIDYCVYIFTGLEDKITNLNLLKKYIIDYNSEIEKNLDEFIYKNKNLKNDCMVLRLAIAEISMYSKMEIIVKQNNNIIKTKELDSRDFNDILNGKVNVDGFKNGKYQIIFKIYGKELNEQIEISGIEYTDWDELSKLAKLISKDNSINNRTNSVNKVVDNKNIKVSVGDLFNVVVNNEVKTVRVLGFNHDYLTNTNAYGEKTATGKAGISFEFVDFATKFLPMNKNGFTVGGWENTDLRKYLNSEEYLNTLNFRNVIKNVNKIFTIHNSNNKVCSDKLWLLSASEILRERGYEREGELYNYYLKNNDPWNTRSDYRKKPTAESGSYWGLRTVISERSFDGISWGEEIGTYSEIDSCVAPGFSI